jgi:hypothetical protein
MARRPRRTRVTLPTRAEPRTIERHANMLDGDASAVDECVSDAVAANARSVYAVATCGGECESCGIVGCIISVLVFVIIVVVFFVIVITIVIVVIFVVFVVFVCGWQE